MNGWYTRSRVGVVIGTFGFSGNGVWDLGDKRGEYRIALDVPFQKDQGLLPEERGFAEIY